MRGPKGILVFVVDENEKRTRGLFGHVCDHDSCLILFLPHTQCYSTIVAQSITCRKIQIYILRLELILNDPLPLFILSKTYQGHLLITEHTSCSKRNSFFLFVFVQKLKQIHCVSKGSTWNMSGRNWANQQLPRKVI